MLENNGFFNDISEGTVITFTVNEFIGWDGWAYPVFAIAIGEKVYLDFDTGYKNILDYLQEKIDYYS